jgi:hypothetical protein
MHIPGVKQEQPDRRPVSVGPLVVDTTVRDENNTRIMKVSHEDPYKVIEIINSLVVKNGSPLYVDTTVRDGGQNRILKVTGEDSQKVIRILNSLIRKTRIKDHIPTESVSHVTDYEDSSEVVSS